MELEHLFTDAKWRMLTALSHGPLSPTELAEETGTSQSNVSTQLRILEAMDFVDQKKLSNIEQGKPRKLYSLKQDFAYLVVGNRNLMGKKFLNTDDTLLFSAWLLPSQKVAKAVMAFYFCNYKLLSEADCIGYIGNDTHVEILVIHKNPGLLLDINEKPIEIDKTYQFNAHLHSKEEFKKGFENEVDYHTSVIKKIYILKDDGFLASLKKQ